MNLAQLPAPPPSAQPVQLELWRRVLQRRYKQIEALPGPEFESFAHRIAVDFVNSLRQSYHVNLARSYYSSLLLPSSNSGPITAKQVALHILALFYTAIDERTPPPERQFSLDAVKRTFNILENQDETDDENEVASSVGGGDEECITRKHGRDDEVEEDEAELPDRKREKKDGPSVEEDDDKKGQEGEEDDEKNDEEEVDDGQNGLSIRSNDGEHVGNKHSSTQNEDEGTETVPPPDQAKALSTSITNKDGENDIEKSSTQDVVTSGENISDPNQRISTFNQNESEKSGNEMEVDANANIVTETQNNELVQDAMDESRGQEKEVPISSKNNSPTAALQNQVDEEGVDEAEPTCRMEVEGDKPNEEIVITDMKNNFVDGAVEAPQDDTAVEEDGAKVDVPEKDQSSSHALGSTNENNVQEAIDTSEAITTSEFVSEVAEEKKYSPLPPPQVYSATRHLSFYADNYITLDKDRQILASGSLHPREPCTVQYDTGYHHLNYSGTLDDDNSHRVNDRLSKWDPYWKIVEVLCRRGTVSDNGLPTKVSTKTASCEDETGISNPPLSCAMVTVDLEKERRNSRFANAGDEHNNPWGVNWGDKTVRSGDKRLLLRTLPLTTSFTEERADCHIWPKGTFIQLKVGDEIEQVVQITQRQQQRRNPSKWSGQSTALDLTPYVRSTQCPFDVKLCCREAFRRQESPHVGIGSNVIKSFVDDSGEIRPFKGIVKSYDPKLKVYRIVYEDDDSEDLTRKELLEVLVTEDGEKDPVTLGSYAIHVAICEYVDPDHLFEEMIGKRGTNFVLPTMSLESVKQNAMESLKNQTLSVFDTYVDDEKDEDCHVFSLLCPITKAVIDTPVRGRECNHLQCFDLRNFLHTNKTPSADRWRCSICQRFLCPQDLIRCGLFDAMLNDLRGDATKARHKVSFASEGNWRPMEEEEEEEKKVESETVVDGPEVIDLS